MCWIRLFFSSNHFLLPTIRGCWSLSQLHTRRTIPLTHSYYEQKTLLILGSFYLFVIYILKLADGGSLPGLFCRRESGKVFHWENGSSSHALEFPWRQSGKIIIVGKCEGNSYHLNPRAGVLFSIKQKEALLSQMKPTFSSRPTCFRATLPLWDRARLMLLPFIVWARRISETHQTQRLSLEKLGLFVCRREKTMKRGKAY